MPETRPNPPGRRPAKRPRIAREAVLAAARKVFARHPYSGASLRMIGREGGFDHSLLHYYFPTKASLFTAVMTEIAEELAEANRQWFEGLDGSDPEAQVALHLDRIMEYDLLHPEPFKILFLNMAELHTVGELPGMDIVLLILSGTRENLKNTVLLSATDEELQRLNNLFANALVNYLGGNQCQAMLLNLPPESRQYREWVRAALLEAFLPWVRRYLSGAGNQEDSGRQPSFS